MAKTLLLIVGLITLLTGCSTYHPLKAPCIYNHPSDCGPPIPLQQNIDPARALE